MTLPPPTKWLAQALFEVPPPPSVPPTSAPSLSAVGRGKFTWALDCLVAGVKT